MVDLLKQCGLAASSSEARRLIAGGAVSFIDEDRGTTDRVMREAREMCVVIYDGLILKVGKRRYRRLFIERDREVLLLCEAA